MRIPPDHHQRFVLNDEVHARPYEALQAPARLSYIALLTDPQTREREYELLAELAMRHGCAPPAPEANHYSADLGPFRIKWERHSEFTRYVFILPGEFDDPFGKTAIGVVPAEWLAELPGQTIFAAHAALQASRAAVQNVEDIAARFFAGNTVVGSTIAGGAATAYTDFRIHGDGFSRFLVNNGSLGTRQAGRMMQRLFEIDTYRMMALLTLPVARGLMPFLAESDRQLVEITDAMANASEQDEPMLLDRITRLSAAVEGSLSGTHYRFTAAAAYYELVERRIGELREERIQGLQTFQEFMERRLAPAMNTCQSVAARQQGLSERVARASQLLSTRVDITHERQNQALLESMNRRAQLQLRLQETVEGLSVAAITYYTVGLVGYAAKATRELGAELNPELVMGASIPVVAVIVALGVRHVRRMVRRTQGAPSD